jgi:hypothetical protein
VLLARGLELTGTAVLHFSDDAQIAPWATSGVEASVAAGYIGGLPNGSFRPEAMATRAQAAKVLAMALDR